MINTRFNYPFFREAERRVRQELDRPPVNCLLSDASGSAIIELLLPGYTKDDIEVTVLKRANERSTLRIAGEIANTMQEGFSYVTSGFNLKKKFSYTTDLSPSAVVSSVTLRNGVMQVLITNFEPVNEETVVSVPISEE